MNRIDSAFAANKAKGRKGVIPYLTAGFPTMDESAALIRAAAEAGSTAVEIGAPFSDPIADGPVIQHSSQIALRNGVNLPRILDLVATLRQRTECPFIIMGYANNFLQYGYQRFARDAAQAGVDGVIVPDLPPEEAAELLTAARAADVAMIFLVAQTSTEARVERLCRLSSGFVYYVARLGVTGASAEISPWLAPKIQRIRACTDLPVAAGFGISNPAQAAAVVAHADAAIIGSALIRLVMDRQGPESAAGAVDRFLAACVGACAR